MGENQIQAGVRKLTGVVTANLGMTDMYVRLWRLLAVRGEPVSVEQLATAGGWPVAEVQAELDRQPGLDWHDDGRVAGFGLPLRLTSHAFTFDGTTVYGFCATDVVNFPAILGRAGVARSTCPATGQLIRAELTPSEVVSVDPPEAVVSNVHLTEAVDNVRDLCDLGHFFSSRETVTIAEEFEIGRRAVRELGWAASSAGPVFADNLRHPPTPISFKERSR